MENKLEKMQLVVEMLNFRVDNLVPMFEPWGIEIDNDDNDEHVQQWEVLPNMQQTTPTDGNTSSDVTPSLMVSKYHGTKVISADGKCMEGQSYVV